MANKKTKKTKKDFEFRPFEGISKTGPYLRIKKDMMESKAWQALNIHSIVVYLYIKAKYNFNNANDISFTYREAAQLMHKSTFTKAIDQLIECGFIKIEQHRWNTRESTIYALTDQWRLYGTDQMKITPRISRKRKVSDNSNG